MFCVSLWPLARRNRSALGVPFGSREGRHLSILADHLRGREGRPVESEYPLGVEPHESASKWGSRNCVSPLFKSLKLNISGDQARRTVQPSDKGFL